MTKEEEIIKYHSLGYSCKKISNLTKSIPKVVYDCLEKNKLERNKYKQQLKFYTNLEFREGFPSNRLDKRIGRIIGDKKRICKNKNIPFDLDKEFLINLWNKQKGKCFYSGSAFSISNTRKRCDKSISLDRVISNLGYIKSNVVFCTSQINTAKSNLSIEELKKWAFPWYKKIISEFPNYV